MLARDSVLQFKPIQASIAIAGIGTFTNGGVVTVHLASATARTSLVLSSVIVDPGVIQPVGLGAPYGYEWTFAPIVGAGQAILTTPNAYDTRLEWLEVGDNLDLSLVLSTVYGSRTAISLSLTVVTP